MSHSQVGAVYTRSSPKLEISAASKRQKPSILNDLVLNQYKVV